jgi:hypothetical protein
MVELVGISEAIVSRKDAKSQRRSVRGRLATSAADLCNMDLFPTEIWSRGPQGSGEQFEGFARRRFSQMRVRSGIVELGVGMGEGNFQPGEVFVVGRQ